MPGAIAHSIPEAAREARVGRSLLYEAIKEGNLTTVKIGRRRLVLADDLIAWLRRHRVTSGQTPDPGTLAPMPEPPAPRGSRKRSAAVAYVGR
jgi:excisionase family DNA binding protein